MWETATLSEGSKLRNNEHSLTVKSKMCMRKGALVFKNNYMYLGMTVTKDVVDMVEIRPTRIEPQTICVNILTLKLSQPPQFKHVYITLNSFRSIDLKASLSLSAGKRFCISSFSAASCFNVCPSRSFVLTTVMTLLLISPLHSSSSRIHFRTCSVSHWPGGQTSRPANIV